MDAEQLTSELELKAMTALSNIIGDYERGLISRAQAMTGCRAVFDTVGGLLGGQVLDLINEATLEFKGVRGLQTYRRQGTLYLHRCGLGSLYKLQARPIDVGQYDHEEPDAAIRAYFKD